MFSHIIELSVHDISTSKAKPNSHCSYVHKYMDRYVIIDWFCMIVEIAENIFSVAFQMNIKIIEKD